MFTGIVEELGTLQAKVPIGTGVQLRFGAPFQAALKIDQSLAHNGVCLTVTEVDASGYAVVAVEETLKRTNLGQLRVGEQVNLERCLRAGDRLDGHFVQGHVDATGKVLSITDRNGSWEVTFGYPAEYAALLVEKGSICVNGVSLTVVDAGRDSFSVAIIPYTWQHTTFQYLQVGDGVNLEFDVLGKYVQRALVLGVG